MNRTPREPLITLLQNFSWIATDLFTLELPLDELKGTASLYLPESCR